MAWQHSVSLPVPQSKRVRPEPYVHLTATYKYTQPGGTYFPVCYVRRFSGTAIPTTRSRKSITLTE